MTQASVINRRWANVQRESRNEFKRWIAPLAAVAGAAAVAILINRVRRRKLSGIYVAPDPGPVFDERRAVVDGIPMRWLEHGQGTPVVLVHGIPTSPQLWRKVVPLLRQAHAFAWEMTGYGASMPEGEGRDISVGRQAEYLAAWIDFMGIAPVVLAGHDLGGGVAQIVAARHPAMCRGIVLTNSICYDSWPIPEVKALRALGRFAPRLPAAPLETALQTLLVRGHDDRQTRRESAALHLRHYREYGVARALLRQVRSLDVNDTIAIQSMLPHLNVPARVVWGMADRFQKPRYGQRLASDLGTALEAVEGGKHFVPEDHPEEVAAALNDLLREVEAEAARKRDPAY
jgi:pimeloyl-ACP methyl ester carboxylesterase